MYFQCNLFSFCVLQKSLKINFCNKHMIVSFCLIHFSLRWTMKRQPSHNGLLNIINEQMLFIYSFWCLALYMVFLIFFVSLSIDWLLKLNFQNVIFIKYDSAFCFCFPVLFYITTPLLPIDLQICLLCVVSVLGKLPMVKTA